MSDESPPEEQQPGPSNQNTGFSTTNEPPKKGILKRPSIRVANTSEPPQPGPVPGYRASPDRFPEGPQTRIPKLSVTWWEKNAVAIFGDTSDENNTDSEQLMKDLGTGKNDHFRQTAILDSEEDSEELFERTEREIEERMREKRVREEERERRERETADRLRHATVFEEDESRADDRDDAFSVASSTGSATSSVVGRWWTGRDTRYIPHCVKRGCNHQHHNNGELGEYLTPTQRRNKEMSELKRELQKAVSERDEKDQHLSELRDRIKEIDILNNAHASIQDSHNMMAREKTMKEEFDREKKLMEKKHAIRVNQLVQETLNAREDGMRVKARMMELEDVVVELTPKSKTDAAVNTEPMQIFSTPLSPISAPTDPTNIHSPSVGCSPHPLSPVHSLPDQSMFMLPPAGSQLSLSMESKISGQPMNLSQDALNHMQAFQNEALIWRTKAAQLEIIVRDQILKREQIEGELQNFKRQQEVYTTTPGTTTEDVCQMLDSGFDNTSPAVGVHGPSPQRKLSNQPMVPISSECLVPSCIDRKKELINENNQLLETNEEVSTRIRELEDDVNCLRDENEQSDQKSERCEAQMREMGKEMEAKKAEIAAANIVIMRLQAEKETTQKAISYMEERMQVYQNTLMNHDLIVTDEVPDKWRKGVPDPRYSVLVCTRVQTELTSEALSRHEDEFQSTKRKLAELHTEFTANRSDLHGRFEEIERILLTKTDLVDALSKQLEASRREQRECMDTNQMERDQHIRAMKELATVAERVPHLESEIDELQKEKGEFEVRLKHLREEYECGLESALDESLRKYRLQSEYWKSKVHTLEAQLERSKNEAGQLIREKEEMKMKWKLEKSVAEQRLTSSIDHVQELNKQLNKQRRDVECEAKPKQVNKYVACRPNVKTKETQIVKGDLTDEAEERLKVCQAELNTTKRQVHVLQQKLITTMQERSDRRAQVRRRVACVVERPTSADGRRESMVEREVAEKRQTEEEILALQSKNAELREKLSFTEEEKCVLVKKERERIKQLVTEFENVRKELDQEMCRYESEKKWLRSRIRNLEKDNGDLQKALEEAQNRRALATSSRVAVENRVRDRLAPDVSESGAVRRAGGDTGSVRLQPRIKLEDDNGRVEKLRKTLSEPEICFDDEDSEDISRLRTENVRLTREVDRLRLSRATSHSQRSQLSPAFANLADDLNLVKTDLEDILQKMDEEEPLKQVEDELLSESQTRRTPFKSSTSDVLDQVMLDWEHDEREGLLRDLERSRHERSATKEKLDKAMADLRSARAELCLYRSEAVSEMTEKNEPSTSSEGALKRSKSVVDLLNETDKEEARRWKQKAGTMFRELNRMRTGYSEAMQERRELRIQLAMLRGELELAKCQIASSQTGAAMSYSYAGQTDNAENEQPQRTLPSTSTKNGRRFQTGSTRESVSCCIQMSVDSSRSRSQTKEVKQPQERSRSAHRHVSKHELDAREQRRNSRKSASVYRTAPQSLSSSTCSLPMLDPTLTRAPLSSQMSQSWHDQPCTAADQRPEVSVREAVALAAAVRDSDGSDRATHRLASLRAKVGDLNRENKALREELQTLRRKRSVISGRSPSADDRLDRLEKEKGVLRDQVDELLRKIQAFENPVQHNMIIDDQLTRSRQENEMFERKIRELEEERREMYLVMFRKGQQAAKMDMKEEARMDQMTQDRVVLKFLHDAFYYFMLNKGDSKEHLHAIMTMLDFSTDQKDEILKKRGRSH